MLRIFNFYLLKESNNPNFSPETSNGVDDKLVRSNSKSVSRHTKKIHIIVKSIHQLECKIKSIFNKKPLYTKCLLNCVYFPFKKKKKSKTLNKSHKNILYLSKTTTMLSK